MIKSWNNSYDFSYKRPWFWFLVRMFWPQAKWGRAAFSFGHTIYFPMDLCGHLIAHELTHLNWMNHSVFYGIIYFVKYRFSRKFRYLSELYAFKYQYQWATHNGVGHEGLLNELAAMLSSGMYGNLIEYQDAVLEISKVNML